MEGLPPDSAVHRARGLWSEDRWLLWSIESRMRDLDVHLGNIVRKSGTSPAKATYLPTPDEGTVADTVADEKIAAQQRDEFDDVTALMFG